MAMKTTVVKTKPLKLAGSIGIKKKTMITNRNPAIKTSISLFILIKLINYS